MDATESLLNSALVQQPAPAPDAAAGSGAPSAHSDPTVALLQGALAQPTPHPGWRSNGTNVEWYDPTGNYPTPESWKSQTQQPTPVLPPAPQAAPVQQQPQPSSLVDMARSIPGGVAKGVAGIVGLAGDANDLLDAGASKLLGRPINTSAPFHTTTQDANNAISQPFGGYYQPKTVAGQYAQTAAEFLPNAVMPGTMAQKIARVLVPAAASETAGQATKGTSFEPYARALGSVGGGVGEGIGETGIANSLNPAPSLEDLSAAKTAAYKAADDAGVVIAPGSFQKFATDTAANITGQNVVQADIHPNTMAALSMLQEEAASGVPISLSRADAIRQAINGAAEKAAGANGSNSDLRLVGKVKSSLDDYLDNLSSSDTLSGDPQTAVPILQNARALAQRQFKGQQIQQMMDLAANSASTNYSASGYEQALRAQFKNYNAQLIKNPNLANTYSDAERAAIANVAQGGPVGNALRTLGKFSAHGPVSTGVGMGLGAMLGSHVGGSGAEGGMVGAFALPAIGEAARSGATAITNRSAKLAGEIMRRGGQAGASAAPNPKALSLGSLLLSQAAR